MDSHLESLIVISSVRTNESDERILIRKLFLTLRVTLQMFIKPFNEICRVNRRSDLFRERQKGE